MMYTLARIGRGRLLGVSHRAVNVTGMTDDYVEFGAVPAKSFYACENISATHLIRRGRVGIADLYALAPGWAGVLGTWLRHGRTGTVAKHRDPLDLRLINYTETDPESGKPWSSKKLWGPTTKVRNASGVRENVRKVERSTVTGGLDAGWRIAVRGRHGFTQPQK